MRWPHKLVVTGEGRSTALYDLDAGEHTPLDAPDVTRQLASELALQLEAARREAVERAPVELTPETLEALRELGYAD